jgi:probable rRNA maturation factor
MPVQFFFNDVKPYLPERMRLRQFIEGIFHNEKRRLESLNFIFCTDGYLLSINRHYLKHDFYTDIITFDLSAASKSPINGEIYISTERVKDNALHLQSTFKEELHRVIFHGVLHLCGYKDKLPAQIKQMRYKEDFYLAKYFEK